MILAIDIGNTNIVLGVMDDESLLFSGRLSTNIYETDEEYAMKLHSFLSIHNLLNIDGAILSSVVPALVGTVKKAVKIVTGITPLIVGPGIKTGLSIKIDDPAQLGADLVVGAVAAKNKYPLPSIFFDLGTATSAIVLNEKGECIGGMIAAGVKTAINALSSNTSLLPQIEISAPKKAIATNTIDCMKCGAVIGTAVMIDGLIDRFEEELGKKTTVIVTGELGESITENCRHDIVIDEHLLLDGLKIIYDKNNSHMSKL